MITIYKQVLRSIGGGSCFVKNGSGESLMPPP
jgi:hypothetical protein